MLLIVLFQRGCALILVSEFYYLYIFEYLVLVH